MELDSIDVLPSARAGVLVPMPRVGSDGPPEVTSAALRLGAGKRLRYAGLIVVVAGCYYGAAKVGLAATALPGNVTPVWPPTGLALAALLLGGQRLWPGVALGALAVNALSEVPFWAAAGMATGNTLEALAGAWLFHRVVHGEPRLARVRDVMSFIGVAAVLATMVSATCGVLSLYSTGVIPGGALWETWRVWWVGDALGALVFAPLVLCWVRRRNANAARSRPLSIVEVAGFAIVGGGATIALAGGHFDQPYVVFPALIWAALRWQQRGATIATLAISIFAVLDTRAGYGAFHSETTTQSLWRLATFLAMVAVTGLVLAAVVSERDAHAAQNAELTAALRSKVEDLEFANAELEYANRELESFAYSVSHDLRAPLRNIDGFSRNLVNRIGPSLDEEAQRQLSRIRVNAKSMGELIDALLGFSRLQRQPLQTEDVDLAEVVAEALGMLETARAGRDLEITVGPLPRVRGDRALLVQVYLNLIGNAIKFTRRPGQANAGAAHIEVGAQLDPQTGERVFFVADDGVGFDMNYVHKMFGVFHRLHRMEDYEGSGIGLALVERIATRHGGRVWARGAPGQGATVFFTVKGSNP